jgi:hypothetical protein
MESVSQMYAVIRTAGGIIIIIIIIKQQQQQQQTLRASEMK